MWGFGYSGAHLHCSYSLKEAAKQRTSKREKKIKERTKIIKNVLVTVWWCWAPSPAVSGGAPLTATGAEGSVPPACPSPPPTLRCCAATRPNKRRWQGRHHSSHPVMLYHCLLVPGMEICGTPQVFGTCCPPWLPAASWAALLPCSAAESSRWKVICLTWCERDFTSIRTLDDRGEGGLKWTPSVFLMQNECRHIALISSL